jgi:hypothetical protein
MGQSPKAFAGILAAPRIAAAAVLALGLVLCLALNLPGQLSYDSIAQLHDGRLGVYNSWHPPVMAWMLGIADSIIPGASLFVAFDAALLFGSFAGLLWLSAKTSWMTVAAAALCVLLPQFLLYQGIVWKDVLFADAAIAGFVCIALAGSNWRRSALRNLLLGKAIALLVLAALARQNGAIALVLGVAAIAMLAGVETPPATRFRAVPVVGGTAALAAFALVLAASLALATRTPGESGPRAQFKLLETYDIVGAVKTDPRITLERIARANPDLEHLLRTDGVRLYTPQRNDTLAASADLQDELSDTPQDVISAQWIELIVHHPWLYLGVRARVFAWTFFTPYLSRCAPFFVGVEGLPRYMRDLGLATRARPQDAALKTYGGLLAETPVFSHAAYAILGIVALVMLLRRRRPEDLVLAILLVAAFTFTLSFFIISIACDYRYLLFLDLSSLTAAFHLVASRPKSA